MSQHLPIRRYSVLVLILIAAAATVGVLFWKALAPASVEKSASRTEIPLSREKGDNTSSQKRELKTLLHHLSNLVERSSVVVSGTIRGAGEPLPDAKVELVSDSGRFTATSDDKGTYTVRVPAGTYRIAARADGYISTTKAVVDRRNGFPSLAIDDALGAIPSAMLVAVTDRPNVDLELSPGASISGVVRNTAGQPQKDVLVSAFTVDITTFEPALLRAALGSGLARTDALGTFALDVPAGEVVLRASRELAVNQPQAVRPIFLEPGVEERVDLTLDEVCTVSGRVVDERGQPISEGSIEIAIQANDAHAFKPRGYFENGRFTYLHDKPGKFYLRLWPWHSSPSPAIEVDCQPGADLHDILVEIPRGEPALSGVVLDEEDNPAANVFVDVIALDPTLQSQQERTDSQGRFEVYQLEPGPYRVSAIVPDSGVAIAQTMSPNSDVLLRLSGTGSLEGEVKGMTDGNIDIVINELLETEGEETFSLAGQMHHAPIQKTVPVVNGKFRLDGIPACLVIGEAKSTQGAQFFQATVEAGRATQVRVSLDGG